jgi:hypothetical protein
MQQARPNSSPISKSFPRSPPPTAQHRSLLTSLHRPLRPPAVLCRSTLHTVPISTAASACGCDAAPGPDDQRPIRSSATLSAASARCAAASQSDSAAALASSAALERRPQHNRNTVGPTMVLIWRPCMGFFRLWRGAPNIIGTQLVLLGSLFGSHT